jgi:hypothetical protein
VFRGERIADTQLWEFAGIRVVLRGRFAGVFPEVNSGVLCIAIDFHQLRSCESESIQSIELVIELFHVSSANERRSDPLIAQDPCDRHLRQ